MQTESRMVDVAQAASAVTQKRKHVETASADGEADERTGDETGFTPKKPRMSDSAACLDDTAGVVEANQMHPRNIYRTAPPVRPHDSAPCVCASSWRTDCVFLVLF
jgi:hypothetical protein